MQAQFIFYKPKFVNLELRHKLTKVLIRLLVKKKKYKNKIKLINPTQPEAEHFKFYWVEGNLEFYWVRIFTS